MTSLHHAGSRSALGLAVALLVAGCETAAPPPVASPGPALLRTHDGPPLRLAEPGDATRVVTVAPSGRPVTAVQVDPSLELRMSAGPLMVIEPIEPVDGAAPICPRGHENDRGGVTPTGPGGLKHWGLQGLTENGLLAIGYQRILSS